MKLFKHYSQFTRFSVVATLYNVATYIVYAILIYIHCNYLLAGSVSFIFGIMLSYFMNKAFVFSNAQSNYRLMTGYFLYYVVLLGISLFMLYGCIDLLKINPYIAQLLTTLLSAGMSYAILRRLFAKEKNNFFNRLLT